MKNSNRKNSEAKRPVEKRFKISDDLLWGIHPVYEALAEEPDRVSEVVVLKDRRSSKIEEIIELARKARVKISFLPGFKLIGPDAAQARHQGVLAKTTQTSLMPFDKMVEKFEKKVVAGGKPRLIVCDSLQDPHNIGAIIRSALASGVDGVLLTRERSAPLGGTAAKSAAGAMSHIDIAQVSNLSESLKKLKNAGAWVFGAVKDRDAVSVYETDFTVPACIVVGSEGKGIRPLVKKECDVIISIPMEGTLDSLNSSVAAAVILFEVMRQNLAK